MAIEYHPCHVDRAECGARDCPHFGGSEDCAACEQGLPAANVDYRAPDGVA